VVHIIQVQVICSGIGYFQDCTWYSSIHFDRDDVSDILVPSLALDENHQKERNAIVASIARIEITTMSSTRVKPSLCFSFLFSGDIGF
jgi:hypothetical protein